jgi:hypothetical protein
MEDSGLAATRVLEPRLKPSLPPAPSKAVGMTPEWRNFADTVDRICALTNNYMRSQEARSWHEAQVRGWSREQAIAPDWRLLAAQGTQILQGTARLRKPPAAAALLRHWRASVALRRDLKLRAAAASSGGDWKVVTASTFGSIA